jgi:sugar/nucleoside kinase (ribokinase family)
LFETDTFEATLDALDGRDNLFAMTRSARGSVIVHGDERVIYPATAVDKVVDTTGAGDAWCAGFLYGWARRESLEECARLGTLCATEVIQRVGARIEPGILDRSG